MPAAWLATAALGVIVGLSFVWKKPKSGRPLGGASRGHLVAPLATAPAATAAATVFSRPGFVHGDIAAGDLRVVKVLNRSAA